MELDCYTFYANIISRSLAYVEINTDDPNFCNAYAVTRNQYILDHFGIYDFPFKHYDASTQQLQAVDVRTGEPVVINLQEINTTAIYGDANLLSPPTVGNPIFFNTLSERDIADIQLPFCTSIKAAKDDGCYNDSPYVREINFLAEVMRFKEFVHEVNLQPGDEMMLFYLNDEFHRKCNTKLRKYVQSHTKHIKFAAIAHVLRQCFAALQQESDPITTFEDVELFFSDVSKIRNVWTAYLKQLVERQIAKYNAEYKQICDTYFAGDEQSRERDFIKIQYDRAIFSLTNVNIDEELKKFGDNVFFILRYIPPDIDTPKELEGIMLFSGYENHVIDTLSKNGVDLDESLFTFDGLDPLWWTYSGMLGLNKDGAPSFSEQLNNLYIDKIKNIRFEQIKRHSNDIVEMVKQEASELDEDDIKEIIDSMQDFVSFKERLDSFTNIVDVVQYWPSVLLPLPSYVARLTGAINHTIDLHNLVQANS